jgi:hypothetical protein
MFNAACTAPPANRLRSIGPVMTISFAANAISVPPGIAKCGAKSVTLALFSQTDMNPKPCIRNGPLEPYSPLSRTVARHTEAD